MATADPLQSPAPAAAPRAGADTAHDVVLDGRGLSKSYPGVKALDDVTFTVRRGEVVGLVGENGAGKSTFLGCVNGSVRPDSGTLLIEGEEMRFGRPADSAKHGVATVYQEQGLVTTMTVTENMFLGRESSFATAGFLKRRALRASAKETLDSLGIDISPNANVGRLSFGDRQLIEIAKAFALSRAYDVRPIILLDEPTSALSEQETQQLLANIRQWRDRASFVFVSHRLAHVFQVCDRIAALKDGRLIAQLDVNEIDEGGLHELIVGRKQDVEYYKETRQRAPEDDVALRVEGVSQRGAFSDVSFELRRGEILGVGGVAGCGKEALARAIMGITRFDGGQVELFGSKLPYGSLNEAIKRGAAYIPANRHAEGVILDHSILWNMTLPLLDRVKGSKTRLISKGMEKRLAKDWVERLNIKIRSVDASAKTLSGGNQQKVVFAKWLGKGVRLLVLDDPGRGLDVGAKESVYTLLRELAEQGVAILLVTDNLPELIGLSNRIILMRGGEVTAEVPAEHGAKPTEAAVVRHMV